MADLSTKDRNELKDSDFGIPSKRKYPIRNTGSEESDRKHVQSAVKLFGHASDDDKPELAYRILQRAKELGMDSSGWEQVNKWAEKYDPKKKSSDVKKESYIPLSEFDHYFQEGLIHNSDEQIASLISYCIETTDMIVRKLESGKWNIQDFLIFYKNHVIKDDSGRSFKTDVSFSSRLKKLRRATKSRKNDEKMTEYSKFVFSYIVTCERFSGLEVSVLRKTANMISDQFIDASKKFIKESKAILDTIKPIQNNVN
jgi:hypothetical protein